MDTFLERDAQIPRYVIRTFICSTYLNVLCIDNVAFGYNGLDIVFDGTLIGNCLNL